jgi:hypothetical protein
MLTPHESRVLGVLLEKAHTTPGQYPLTLNAILSGCNQKSNRHPVTSLTEDDALAALDGLREKELAREVMMSGSRVAKFRHNARDTLELTTSQLVVLAELLLRGPQTVGELRGRATRMHPLESIEVVRKILDELMSRQPTMVQRLEPAPGSRAERFAQLLCPDLHPLDGPSQDPCSAPAAPSGLDQRVDRLEIEVAQLRRTIEQFLAAESSTNERIIGK